jgi:hypothetical protein
MTDGTVVAASEKASVLPPSLHKTFVQYSKMPLAAAAADRRDLCSGDSFRDLAEKHKHSSSAISFHVRFCLPQCCTETGIREKRCFARSPAHKAKI